MKIGFIGCGVYALALSKIFKENKCHITMWSKFEDETNNLRNKYDYIKFTNNLENIANTELVVIAIPSSFIIDTIKEFKKYYNNNEILIASKGILKEGSFISETVEDILNTKKISVISGPTFATDIEPNIPLALSLGCNNISSIKLIKQTLETNYLKLENINDIIGIEFCGSIKNVIAISTGIIEGLGYPESTRYKYLTNVINDLYRVISLIGGKKTTVNSFAGIGDLLLTSTSTKSRNYSLGLVIGKKENYHDYIKNHTTEGYYTLNSLYKLLSKKNIKMEIVDILYNIIYKNEDINYFIEYIKQ